MLAASFHNDLCDYFLENLNVVGSWSFVVGVLKSNDNSVDDVKSFIALCIIGPRNIVAEVPVIDFLAPVLVFSVERAGYIFCLRSRECDVFDLESIAIIQTQLTFLD